MIKRQSQIDFIQSRKPEQLEHNPLFKDRISKEAIKLREKLDDIIGTDSDQSMIGKLTNVIELTSSIHPIPRDNDYTHEQIGEYLTYLDEVEKWREENREFENDYFDDNKYLPPMSFVYSTEKNDFILVMNSQGSYVRSIGTDEMESLVSERYTTHTRYYQKASLEDIEHHLYDVNFDNLRKRLINGGYSEFVSNVDRLLISS